MQGLTPASPILGRATQLGFVVRDIEQTMRHFVEVLGTGPFLYLERGTGRPASTTYFRGAPTQVELRLAFGFMGDVQVELIEQVNDQPSPYREFLAAGQEGLQHFGFWVDDHEVASNRLVAAGYLPEYEIPVAGQPRAITYYRSPANIGPMIELVPPVWRRSRAAVKAHLEAQAPGTGMVAFETYGAFLKHAGVTFD